MRPKKILKNTSIFFSFFPHAGTVEENTGHFEVLLLFWALDMARTYAGPDLFPRAPVIVANNCELIAIIFNERCFQTHLNYLVVTLRISLNSQQLVSSEQFFKSKLTTTEF